MGGIRGERSRYQAKKERAKKVFEENRKSKPLKRRKKKVINKPPIFKIGDCLTFQLSNGNYSGAIVIGEHGLDTHYESSNVIISTNINQKTIPKKEDFIEANVLILNHNSHKNTVRINEYSANRFEEYKDKFSVVTQIEINPEIPIYFRNNFCGNSPWNWMIDQFEMELDWTKKIRRKIKVLTIKDVLLDLKLKETRNKI